MKIEGMYGLIGKVSAVHGQRTALAAALLGTTDALPGCLSYIVAADPADSDALWVTEVWEDVAAHRASLRLPTVQAAIASARPLIAGFSDRRETAPMGGYGLMRGANGTVEEFAGVNPGELAWGPHPVVPGAGLAVLYGNPNAAGAYGMRLRFPAGTRMPPHTHPDARTYTVLEGEWSIGFGAQLGPSTLREFPAGGVYRLPPNVAHAQVAGPNGALVQVDGTGPTSTDLLS